MEKIQPVLEQEKPDIVLVHGDTTTTFATALAAFYMGIKVGHVEAGLRTYNLQSPYPEEFNRQATSIVADYNFAPTQVSKENLQKEGRTNIFVTGNTVIDALKTTVQEDYDHPILEWAKGSKLIMLTAHRRENLGEPMEHMFRAVNRILEEFEDVKVVYPIHKNPKVRELASKIFGENERMKIIEPLEVIDFHNFMNQSYMILTERPEGVAAGTLKLVGTEEENIYRNFKLLLEDQDEYEKMSQASNPYGDGTACQQIVEIIMKGLA